MNIVVERQPKCLATLRVEVPADKVASERGQIVNFYANRARIPGFRPGKAPRAVIEKRFQKEIAEELESRLVREAIDEALQRDQLRVLDIRGPQSPEFHLDGAFSFTSQLLLAPDFELPEYKGIAVKVPKAEITDEILERNLSMIRERHADFADVTDRPAAGGDFAIIDFTSTLDGQAVEEAIGRQAGLLAGREGHWVKLDPESFLPGFAAAAEGMETGTSRDIPLTLPADFPIPELREREVVFHVTLKELKQQVLPEIDQALVDRVAPGQTLDTFRDFLRDQLLLEFERRISEAKVNQIVEFLNSRADFELPDELVTAETQSQADAMVERGLGAGMSNHEIQAQQHEIFAAAGQQARLNLKTNFILQEIARAEKLAVSDRELLERIAASARQRRQPLKKFFKQLQDSGRIPGLRNSMLIAKAIDFVVSQANVEETEPAASDVDPDPDSESHE
jgi:trigger factor